MNNIFKKVMPVLAMAFLMSGTGTFLSQAKTIYYHNGTETLNTVSLAGGAMEKSVDTVRENQFIRNGYTFDGWYTKEGKAGTKYTAGQTISGDGDIDLYAGWNIKSYRITYIMQGCGIQNARASYTVEDDDFTIGAATAPANYTFTGWTSGSEGVKRPEFDVKLLFNEDNTNVIVQKGSYGSFTLYANKKYTGSAADALLIRMSDPVINHFAIGTAAADAFKKKYILNYNDGYTNPSFNGANAGKPLDPTDNEHVQWPDEQPTVAQSTVNEPETFTVSAPARYGYTLAGYDAKVLDNGKDGGSVSVHTGTNSTVSDIKISPLWNPNKYSIKYLSTADTVIGTQSFNYGESDVIDPASVKRQGYVFTGWVDSNGKEHQPNEVVRDWTGIDNTEFKLTAQWIDGKDATGESAKDAEHSHVWVDNYDEHYHWKECSICGTIQSGSKQAHTLQTTGSCYRMNDNGGAAMRQVCTACGYKSKPLYAILGKWENYSNYYAKNGFASSNYDDGPGNLNNVQQISYSEFRSRYGDYEFFSGQPCTWADPDGDGFGWVFGGGFVITRSKAERNNGMRSTLDLLLGSANTHPAPNCEDEFPEVYRILRDGRDSGKSNFLNNLTYKESTNSRSYLYGIREKYQNISIFQWNQIVSMLAGYTPHKSGWGWQTEDLLHPSAMNGGNSFYGHGDYDSGKNHGPDFSNGIATHCDVCGVDYDGYEAIRRNWYVCEYPTVYAKTLKDGKIHECGGHTVYGKGWTPIATIYDSYQMSGNNIVEVSRRVVTLQDGVSWSLDTSDDTTLNRYIIGSHNVRPWDYPYYDSTFTYGGVTTHQACGYRYPDSDITNPSSISVSDVPSKKANVNGVTWVISTKMTISGYDGVDLSNAYESIKHTVHVSLSDGSKTLYEGDTQCNSSNYFSLTFTPEMEADSSGKTFTIKVTDPYGNSSSIQKVYRNIDARLPDILNTEDYTGQWSTYKTITLKATDTGVGHVKFGMNNVSDLQEGTLSSDGKTYTRDYTFGGDVYSDDAWVIFAQDAVGNLASKSLHIGLIDNTAPTIANVTLNGRSASVTANDENADLKAKGKAYVGSGVVQYGYLGTNDEDITWQNSNVINLPSSGKFYIFAKDKVGNISKKYAVNAA